MKAAYIGRIYIENFHAFQGKNEIPIIKEDGTLQQWTVIVGENNSGKTSLLKAVAGLEPVKSLSNNINSYTTLAGCYIRPVGIGPNRTTEVGCDIYVTLLDYLPLPQKSFEYFDESFNFDRPWWSYKTVWSIDYEFAEYSARSYAELENLKIYGYGVSRKVGNDAPYANKDVLGKNALTLLFKDEQLADFTDWLFQLNFASKNSENKITQTKATDRIAHIKNLIISEIFPDISDLRFTTTDDLKNLLEFQTKDGWFQLHELGYGYQTTLAWIFDLSKKMMERYPESKQPLREPAVVLIDEIDLHLHPSWQRRIINYLSDNFTATQFIVTTHSPHVLQELKEVNLVQLKRENGATKIICRPNSSFQGWTIEEILNDVLETPSTHSTRYEELMQEFDKALDNEDFKTAHEVFETLSKILHPNSPDRKILKLQLSQLVES